MANDDLDPAVLTKAQRRYLRGEDELDSAQERAIRGRIRNRLEASAHDFSLLLEHVGRDEPALGWHDIETALDGADTPSALAFFLALFVPLPSEGDLSERARKSPGQYPTDSDQIGFLVFVLQKALDRACEARDHERRYEIQAEPKETVPQTPGELKQELRHGEITIDEIEQLYRDGRIDRDTFARVVVDADEFEE